MRDGDDYPIFFGKQNGAHDPSSAKAWCGEDGGTPAVADTDKETCHDVSGTFANEQGQTFTVQQSGCTAVVDFTFEPFKGCRPSAEASTASLFTLWLAWRPGPAPDNC